LLRSHSLCERFQLFEIVKFESVFFVSKHTENNRAKRYYDLLKHILKEASMVDTSKKKRILEPVPGDQLQPLHLDDHR